MRTVIWMLLSTVAFVGAIWFFLHTTPYSGAIGYVWLDFTPDRTLPMLLVFAALFLFCSLLLARRASANIWFLTLAASALPTIAALLPCAYYLRRAERQWLYGDEGSDVDFEIAIAKRTLILSLILCALLVDMVVYGYFRSQKT